MKNRILRCWRKPYSSVRKPYEYADTFARYYAAHEVWQIGMRDVPSDVMADFERLSMRFILPDQYTKGNFEKILMVRNLDGSISYIAQQTKQYMSDQFGKPGEIEKIMLIREKAGPVVFGAGEVRYCTSSQREFLARKPFVGWTETRNERVSPEKAAATVMRRGFGLRRLELMNALTQAEYGLPLYSDIGGGAQSFVWEKLIALGEAQRFHLSDGRMRYVMAVAPDQK